ncbi:restriction endonuclease-related protein [Micromonospora sp. NBC_01813]|uniref:restriction endonuclease-related protein n=1 Tax=Micromonospora sp. NBC_01813 TaxID=2975988 RepID=UPI002DD9CE30|nr:hypothetical protein [Micromonospora sp. NBC_01813]WSA06947.1 hypothetical protein OG958_22135 [Micromonospora sp. NBC_01813]
MWSSTLRDIVPHLREKNQKSHGGRLLLCPASYFGPTVQDSMNPIDMTADASKARSSSPTPADDYLTVTMLCGGLAQMIRSRNHPRSEAADLGLLPASWRVGFSRVWWRCLGQGCEGPASDLELMTWCARPLITWDVDLALSDSDLQHELLVGDELSMFAEQAARLASSADVEAEWVENQVFKAIRAAAAANGGTDDQQVEVVYAALRRLLIDRPVLSDADLFRLEQQLPEADNSGQTYVRRLIEHAYTSTPASGTYRYLTCPGCGNPVAGGEPCGTPGCTGGIPEPKSVKTIRRFYEHHRATRRFIHDPGLVEVRIMDTLSKDPTLDGRVEVVAYPRLDMVDILIEFLRRDGRGEVSVCEVWAVDAKDQLSARLLGRRFEWPAGFPCDKRFLAIPKHRADQGQYLKELKSELDGRPGSAGVTVVREDVLIDSVKVRAKELTA